MSVRLAAAALVVRHPRSYALLLWAAWGWISWPGSTALDVLAESHPTPAAHKVPSGDGLVEVGSQPAGALTGKIVFVHAGHGWLYDQDTWRTQRGEVPGTEMVEDFGNIDQMNFLVDYLFRAGATVVPLRPTGHQIHEVVLDNEDPQVTWKGSWTSGSDITFYGSPGDVPCRWATANATETATVCYQPRIPQSGFYPVYTWAPSGANRLPDQLYRIKHSGGITEVKINHRRVCNGWVYLGKYYLPAGVSSYVEISNRSNSIGVVVADAIRFGNGMGDVDDGGGVSGKPREDEAGLYWIRSQFGQGTSTAGIASTVAAPPRWAVQMNRQADGASTDRLFFSFHSNASGDRGTLALYNGNNDPATATPHQRALAQIVGQEVNDDLVAQNGQYEHDWHNRTRVTLDRADIEFGEINNRHIDGEFDATILEVAFHDNVADAQLMRDPKVRDAVARASYQAIVRYFHTFDGGTTPLVMAPAAVTNARAVSNGDGTITISWKPPASNSYLGDPATDYRIYTSLDGYGYDGGTLVPGGAATSHTLTVFDRADGLHYFRIAAVNAGGESPGSSVVAARPATNNGHSRLLIVDGFDRLGRAQNQREPFGDDMTDRVRQRYGNTRDYAVQLGEAIEAFATVWSVDTASNDEVKSGQINLHDYQAAFWILGEESTADSTFDAAEQKAVAAYLADGGCLFISGAEIGWDLDRQNHGRSFYNNTLQAAYVADDAGTYKVRGAAGSIFAGLSFAFDDGTFFYDTETPDVLSPLSGATTALHYVGGTGGTAAIQLDGGSQGKVVMLGFPFETITDPMKRADVMARVLDFFATRSP